MAPLPSWETLQLPQLPETLKSLKCLRDRLSCREPSISRTRPIRASVSGDLTKDFLYESKKDGPRPNNVPSPRLLRKELEGVLIRT